VNDINTFSLDFWDTAGQEAFNSLHSSYYHRAHCCILVFDVTRKITYQNLSRWYDELQSQCKDIPCVLVANKIDVNYKVTSKEFKFGKEREMPFFFASSSDGVNVVAVMNLNELFFFHTDMDISVIILRTTNCIKIVASII
jgi:Rab-like protein 2